MAQQPGYPMTAMPGYDQAASAPPPVGFAMPQPGQGYPAPGQPPVVTSYPPPVQAPSKTILDLQLLIDNSLKMTNAYLFVQCNMLRPLQRLIRTRIFLLAWNT